MNCLVGSECNFQVGWMSREGGETFFYFFLFFFGSVLIALMIALFEWIMSVTWDADLMFLLLCKKIYEKKHCCEYFNREFKIILISKPQQPHAHQKSHPRHISIQFSSLSNEFIAEAISKSLKSHFLKIVTFFYAMSEKKFTH